ncbi:MAG TPA: hypothetical protein VIY27_08005 [Myxococcota bacterium]
MRSRTAQKPPPRLEAGRQRFERWRSECEPRTRIPEALWTLASELGVEFGVHRTARALRLNYDALKARVMVAQAGNGSGEPARGFVEVFAGSVPGARQCMVELEDGHGARMRVHLDGVDAAMLGALTSAFVGRRG